MGGDSLSSNCTVTHGPPRPPFPMHTLMWAFSPAPQTEFRATTSHVQESLRVFLFMLPPATLLPLTPAYSPVVSVIRDRSTAQIHLCLEEMRERRASGAPGWRDQKTGRPFPPAVSISPATRLSCYTLAYLHIKTINSDFNKIDEKT